MPGSSTRKLSYLLLATAFTAVGQRPQGLADASLEELLGIRVTSVGRKEQKLTETAAAVYVLTREDLLRSGVTSVPEALRMVPGVQVARIDSNKWAVTARGFNGRFANKMLVLIDGRSIYTNLYSGVYWEQYDVMLEDVERIEVVRGPGATMWGANAVNGVINIITRQTKDTQGGLLVAGTGTEDLASTALRYGGRFGDRIHYRTFGKFFNRNQMLTAGGDGAGDSWNTMRAGGRVDIELSERDSITLTGDMSSGLARGALYSSFPLPQQGALVSERVNYSGGFGLGRWTRKHSDRSEFSLQVYLNKERRSEHFGDAKFQTIDLDFQHRVNLSRRHDLVWGLGYRMLKDNVHGGTSAVVFEPVSWSGALASSFVQDDVTLVSGRLVATFGSKFLNNYYTGFEIQPTARLMWTPNRNQSLWGAVSRAVRTPARYNRDVRVPFSLGSVNGIPVQGALMGSHDFGSETVRAYEAGYRHQLSRWAALDLALFQSEYGNLAGFALGEPHFSLIPSPRVDVPVLFANTSQARSRGVELASSWTPAKRWKMQANYAWMLLKYERGGFEPFPGGNTADGSTPRHSVQLHSGLDLSKRIRWDVQMFQVGALPSLGVPGYTRVDTRLSLKVGEGFELSGGGRNLLDARHLEFTPEDSVRAAQIRRTLYLQLTRRF